MQQVSRETVAGPRDPAPSRWSYRMQRMWLTPAYRRLLRIGTPLMLLGAAAFWYVSDPQRVEYISDSFDETKRAIQERPEFMLRMMSVEGASEELSAAIRDAFPIRFPLSSFDLDLDALRAEIASFNAVADARLRIRPGGVLEVEIEQRQPALLWRHAGGLALVDATGHLIAGAAERADFPELPLVAGAAAEQAVPEALQLFKAAAPLDERLRGLVRMGERRWDVILDRGQRVLLPEQGAVEALEYVVALDRQSKVLERDLAIIDFRNPRRPTVRLNTNAVHELRRTRELAPGGIAQ